MAQGQPFLPPSAGSSGLQSVLTAMQDAVRAVSALSQALTAALGNLANPG